MRHYEEYILDSEEDIQTPPPECELAIAGSVAYVAGLTRIWQKANDGSWVEIGA